jgi:hypothetical protein
VKAIGKIVRTVISIAKDYRKAERTGMKVSGPTPFK